MIATKTNNIRLMTSIIVYKEDIDKGEYEFLLLQRSKNTKMGNMWNLPGGKVEEYETYEEAIKRELKEETNLDLEELDDFGYFMSSVEEGREHIARPIFFSGKIREDSIQKIRLDHENSIYGWFIIEEIKEMKLIFNQSKIIENLLSKKLHKKQKT